MRRPKHEQLRGELTKAEGTDYWEDLKKARGRVGFTGESTTKWLLRSIRLPLEELGERDRRELQWEVTAFSTYTAFRGQQSQVAVQPIYDWYSLFREGDLSLPSHGELKHLLGIATQHVNDLVDQGKTSFDSLHLSGFSLARSSSGIMRASSSTGSAASNVQYALLILLQRYGDRISRCPCCSQLFFRSRSDKEACSSSCRSKQNIRKRRKTPPERFGKRGRPRAKT